MKYTALFIPLIALALSACETSHPYRGGLPPEDMQPGRTSPAPGSTGGAAPIKPVTVAPLGPLKPQNIAIYMDGLEKDLRARLRGSTYLILRRGDELFIGAQNAQIFDTTGGLTEPASGWLSRMSISLKRYDRTKLEVAGFTDTTGPNDKNLELSNKRAQKIADTLTALGVKSSRVKMMGYGETRLKVNTGDDVSEPRNRRIEIKVSPTPG